MCNNHSAVLLTQLWLTNSVDASQFVRHDQWEWMIVVVADKARLQRRQTTTTTASSDSVSSSSSDWCQCISATEHSCCRRHISTTERSVKGCRVFLFNSRKAEVMQLGRFVCHWSILSVVFSRISAKVFSQFHCNLALWLGLPVGTTGQLWWWCGPGYRLQVTVPSPWQNRAF